jgi:hypothetical protein
MFDAAGWPDELHRGLERGSAITRKTLGQICRADFPALGRCTAWEMSQCPGSGLCASRRPRGIKPTPALSKRRTRRRLRRTYAVDDSRVRAKSGSSALRYRRPQTCREDAFLRTSLALGAHRAAKQRFYRGVCTNVMGYHRRGPPSRFRTPSIAAPRTFRSKAALISRTDGSGE